MQSILTFPRQKSTEELIFMKKSENYASLLLIKNLQGIIGDLGSLTLSFWFGKLTKMFLSSPLKNDKI